MYLFLSGYLKKQETINTHKKLFLTKKQMKLDILVFAAHPDDAELSCAGTIMSHIKQGKKVGIVDLTRGELGTRGTAATRYQLSLIHI